MMVCTYYDHRPGASCEFTCPSGYSLHGFNHIYCTSMGTWSKPPPVCKGISRKCCLCNKCKRQYVETFKSSSLPNTGIYILNELQSLVAPNSIRKSGNTDVQMDLSLEACATPSVRLDLIYHRDIFVTHCVKEMEDGKRLFPTA